MNLIKIKKHKKGIIADLLYMAFILFMLAVFAIIMYKVVSDYRQTAEGDISEANLAPIVDYENRAPGVWNAVFVFVLFGMSIISLASALFINSHPIFYGIMMFMLGILAWFNAIYAETWYTLTRTSDFITIVSKFVIIDLVIRYFPITLFIIGAIVGIIMVSKGD